MSHHAPRGPVKARAPHEPKNPMSQRCSAQSKQKHQQCGHWAIRGGTVCRYHGGLAPQVKAAAEKRLEDLRPAAISYMDWLLNQKEYPSAGLGAAKDVLDRNDGKPAEKVDMHLSGSFDVVTVLKSRQARRAESVQSLDKMPIVHHTETDAGDR